VTRYSLLVGIDVSKDLFSAAGIDSREKRGDKDETVGYFSQSAQEQK